MNFAQPTDQQSAMNESAARRDRTERLGSPCHMFGREQIREHFCAFRNQMKHIDKRFA